MHWRREGSGFLHSTHCGYRTHGGRSPHAHRSCGGSRLPCPPRRALPPPAHPPKPWHPLPGKVSCCWPHAARRAASRAHTASLPCGSHTNKGAPTVLARTSLRTAGGGCKFWLQTKGARHAAHRPSAAAPRGQGQCMRARSQMRSQLREGGTAHCLVRQAAPAGRAWPRAHVGRVVGSVRGAIRTSYRLLARAVRGRGRGRRRPLPSHPDWGWGCRMLARWRAPAAPPGLAGLRRAAAARPAAGPLAMRPPRTRAWAQHSAPLGWGPCCVSAQSAAGCVSGEGASGFDAAGPPASGHPATQQGV